MTTRREFCILLAAAVPAACGSGQSGGAATDAQGAKAEPFVPPPEQPMFGPDGRFRGTFDWRRAPIPAGGFVIGLDISKDGGRMLHWADVFNGYIRNAGDKEWQLLLRRDTLAAEEYRPRPKSPTTDSGVYAARIAPSNRNVIYASWNGFIYKSTDGGGSFIRTALPPKRMQSNLGPQRRFNRALDVHPTDPDRVIVGTNNDGVHYSVDGGANWKAIALPVAAKTAGSESKYLVAFGPGDAVYVHVPGSGLYRSTTGPAGAFANVGGPTSASCLVLAPSGTVYLCEYRNGGNEPPPNGLKRYDGNAWTALSVSPDQVAIDPFDETHIFVVGENLLGNSPVIRRSRDGGKTWTAYRFTRGSGEVAWLSNRNKASFPAQILFDPVVRNKLWMADGVGITWSMLAETEAMSSILPWVREDWTLHDFSNGNAELVPTLTVSVPGHPPILCFWDKPFWRLEDDREPTNMWSYPVAEGKSFSDSAITVGFGVDYAPDDPDFLVGVAGQGSNLNGYSTDGGRTWTEFSAKPAAPFRFGGAVAVSTRRNFVVLSANNGSGAFTLDGGSTWEPVSLDGISPTTGWTNAYFVNRLNIAADKTRQGVFAAVYHNLGKFPDGRDRIGNPLAGIWLSQDGGRTWTHRFNGLINGATGSQAQFWQCRLRYVPGLAGELLYADGDGHPRNTLMWSKDDGATWQDVSANIRNVTSFGFGKAPQGKSRPAVYFYGTVKGNPGVYASFDWFASDPVLVSAAPLETISSVSDVTGDLNIVGRCYAMISGNGAALCDYRAT